ncbi:NAD(P)/FAD-dependent oxidoreductase [Nocardioides allogilvus]|nr:FAD-dependent oxidoreductase [Nocardioides allogilvus]
MPDDPVVVVGAGLAGLRAVEGLLREDHPGRVLVFGDEPHPPYNRPALSKDLLDDGDVARLGYRVAEDPRVVWRTASRVAAAHLTDRTLRLEDGDAFAYTGLVIASGIRPRRLLVPGPTAGRFTVRTMDDVLAVRRALGAASRVTVVGGGVLGCELSSTLCRLGAHVDLVLGPEPVPLRAVAGETVGTELMRRHRAEGTRVHPDESVCAYTGIGRVDGLLLSSGRHLAADLVIEAVGSVPDLGWLVGHRLDVADGVPCEADLFVQGHPEAVACGDVARLPDGRAEHWARASETGRHAGRALARRLRGTTPLHAFRHVPTWWSDQVGVRLHGLGRLSPTADLRVLEGSLHESAVVGYHDAEGLSGVLLIDAPGRLPHYRRLLSQQPERVASA